MPEPSPVTPPETVEGFRVGALLRRSGVLFVHAGTSRLDLPVEASFVRVSDLTGGFEADDFLAGVRRAAAVHHEGLLPFVTGGVTDGLVFAIAKSLEGRSLEETVAQSGPLEETRAVALANTLAGALAALESGGLRHGGLEPSRIFVAGVQAFVAAPPRLLPASLAPRSERWQAPEEARGGEHGVQSDLFVLGLVLVFALTGAHPLGGAADARRALRDWKTPDVVALLRGAGPETRAVVGRLLAAEPANRFASAADAQRAIETAAAAEPETAPIGVPSAAPVARPAAETAKRSPGRLYFEARLGESMLEIDDDAVYVGVNPSRNVRSETAAFPEAAIRVERTAAADVVHAMSGALTVNGRAVESQSLADGDRVEAAGIVARYERAARAALRSSRTAAEAPPANSLAGAVTALALTATMGIAAWGVWRITGSLREASDAESVAARSRQALAEERKTAAAAESASAPQPSAATVAERAARDEYDAAAQWARRHPTDARTKFYEVWQRRSDTAYGLLARLDALEIDRRTKPAPDRTLEAFLAAADAPDGNVDDETLMKLRGWMEDHPGTLGAERAHLVLVRVQALQRGRFDGDMAAIRAAVAKKDWKTAQTLVSKVFDYAPPHLLSEVQAERDKIVKAMGETLLESAAGGGAPGDAAAGGRPKDGAGGKPDEAERNRKAEEVFRAARKAMDGGRDVEALDGFLTLLRLYKDTPNGTKYDLESRSRITTLTTGPAGIVKLFRGKVEKADNKGRWRVSYDFSDPAQFQDFRDVNAFEAPPRALWKVEGGAVKNARGSGALVLDAVFQPGDVAASVSISPKKPHDLGVLFVDPSEQRRFYLFMLQNTFFKLGKGDDAKPFLENAIVLFGPNMWRDTPPNQLGFVRKCGSEEPQVRESEAMPVRAGKTDAEVWMKFEGGRSIRGSAYGDKKYDFPGVTPGLFVISSEGWFDDFVVEGTPDVDWVQRRWRAILSDL